MRFLSFDIECAKTYGRFSPICNFGYVIYDEHLNLIEKRDMIINPKTSFKTEGRPGRPDVKLFYDKETYKKAPGFPSFYQQIKALLEQKDQIVMNHAVINDIEYLQNECKRYKLPYFRFDAYDTVDAYKAFSNSEKSLSLDKLVETYTNSNDFTHHKADDDAEAAIRYYFELSHALEVNPIELISLANMKTYPSDYIRPYNKNNDRKKEIEKLIIKYKNMNADCDFFNKKSVAVSFSIEKDIETLEHVIRTVYQLGGVFTKSVSNADIFIYEKDKHCKRCDSFIFQKEEGKDIISYTLDTFNEIIKQELMKLLFSAFTK